MFNDCTERHSIEDIIEQFPEMQTNSLFAFFIETKESIDTGCLMMTPQQKDMLRKPNFIAKQQNNALKRVGPPINIISQEQITDLTRIA